MATIKSDELNIVRAIPFDEYFEPMAIEDYQKEQRIRLAEEISKAIFYILLMFETAKALKLSLDAEQMRESMAQRYLDAIEGLGYDINDPYYEEHIRETSDSLVTTTIDNLNNPWFTSQDRADYIAEDEANSIANHADLEEAKGQGYTDKTWKTMKDERVRHTHRAVDETTVGIDEPFIVGHYKMLAPRDDSLGAGLEEIIRCRCSLFFGKKTMLNTVKDVAKVGEENYNDNEESKDIDFSSMTFTSVISPDMEQKILWAMLKDPSKRELIGGHSPRIVSKQEYIITQFLMNEDGTADVRFKMKLQDGAVSKTKHSTLFPSTWSDEYVLSAIKYVGDMTPIQTRESDGATIHVGIVNGLKIMVVKIGDDVKAGYPSK